MSYERVCASCGRVCFSDDEFYDHKCFDRDALLDAEISRNSGRARMKNLVPVRNLIDIHLVDRLQGHMAIHADDGREIVRINPAGDVVVHPAFTIDQAARAFWDAVKKLAARP